MIRHLVNMALWAWIGWHIVTLLFAVVTWQMGLIPVIMALLGLGLLALKVVNHAWRSKPE